MKELHEIQEHFFEMHEMKLVDILGFYAACLVKKSIDTQMPDEIFAELMDRTKKHYKILKEIYGNQ